MLGEWIAPDDTPQDVLAHLGRAIAEDDSYALQIRDLIADYVSRATAIAINCYDPDLLILAGYVIAQCPEHFIQAAQGRLASDVFDHYSRDIKIVVAKSGEQAVVRGIATAVLRSSMERV